MAHCVLCGNSGWFFSFRKRMCRSCREEFSAEVPNRLRIIVESEEIVYKTKNTATKVSRLKLLLQHCEALLKYENAGINLTSPKPSEIIAEYTQMLEAVLASNPGADKKKVWHLGEITGQDPSTFLKGATAKKEQGDLDAAVDLLKNAYAEIAAGKSEHPVSVFLRLPQYLDAAGRSREAWEAFQDLLEYGYPRSPRSKDLKLMDHSAIYDKMRLSLQRAKKHDAAVKYGIFSYVARVAALKRQRRKEELAVMVDRSEIADMVEGLLKKSKHQDLAKDITEIIVRTCKHLNKVDFEALGRNVDALLGLL